MTVLSQSNPRLGLLHLLYDIDFTCSKYKPRGGGVLLGIFGGDVPLASPNLDPISDQILPFPTPVFRPDLARD